MSTSIVEEKINVNNLSMATVRFKPGDVPGQRGAVADFFVETGSKSRLILATGGNSEVAAADTAHVTIILAEPHQQGGRLGIRVRVNFARDAPPSNQWFEITLAQVGATDFKSPVKTTGLT